MEQRTDEWFQARCGKFSASEIINLKEGKNGYVTAARKNLIASKVCQRLTGVVEQGFTSPAMQHGIDTEDEARDAYFIVKELPIEETGFVVHPSIDFAGASPDGLVGDDGLVEIKCPNTATHLEYLLNDVVPENYLWQMQWQMACTGRNWCDFVSYDPRLPEEYALFIKRVERDDTLLTHITSLVVSANDEVNEMISKLEEWKNGKA